VSDIELGSLGLSGEGWFDGPALHAAMLRKARAQGALLLRGEAVGFDVDGRGRVGALRLADGRRIACGHAVNAAGPWARQLAAAAGVALPVHARRRTVFVLSCPQPLPGCPLLVDPTGFWLRPEGRNFIAGSTPRPDEDDLPLEPNLAEFDDAMWLRVAHRVPAFEALRIERAWAGYYEMNLFDHNAVIGAHPDRPNLLCANGFSGHGMQQAPAAGLGVAELVLHGGFRTLDLSALGFARLIEGRPLLEANVIG
jgi:FAD-dependent oxidoreductase domain-containing protein 1